MNDQIYTSLDELPIVLTVDEVRQVLHIGRNKAYSLINSGAIRTIKVGEHTRILKTELIRFLEGGS